MRQRGSRLREIIFRPGTRKPIQLRTAADCSLADVSGLPCDCRRSGMCTSRIDPRDLQVPVALLARPADEELLLRHIEVHALQSAALVTSRNGISPPAGPGESGVSLSAMGIVFEPPGPRRPAIAEEAGGIAAEKDFKLGHGRRCHGKTPG